MGSRYDELVAESHTYLVIEHKSLDDALRALTLAQLATADALHRLALVKGAF